MNILWLCNDNTANIPYTISKGINEYTQHEAQLIQAYTTYLKYPIDGTIFTKTITKERLLKWIKWADIIHFNDYTGQYPNSRGLKDSSGFDVVPFIPKTTKVFNHTNGTYYRKRTADVNQWGQIHHIQITCSTLDLLDLGHANIWIPQPIDLKKYEFKPAKYNGRIILSHSPSPRKSWIVPIIKNACKKNGIIYRKIQGVDNAEALRQRSKCHIHFDHVGYGAYGLVSLEGLALGQLVIADLAKIEHRLKGHPFIVARTKEQIFNAVSNAKKLMNNRRQRRLMLNKSYRWLKEVHSTEAVVKRLCELYDRHNV